jgi:hypothetical protein
MRRGGSQVDDHPSKRMPVIVTIYGGVLGGPSIKAVMEGAMKERSLLVHALPSPASIHIF